MYTAHIEAPKHTSKAYEHFGEWYKTANPTLANANNINFREMAVSYEGGIFVSNQVKIMRQTNPENPYFAEMQKAAQYDPAYRPVGTVLVVLALFGVSYYLIDKYFLTPNKPAKAEKEA